MIKLTVLLRRHPDLSMEDFVVYHRTKHAALFRSLPEVQQHVRRYVQQHPVEGDVPGMPPRTFDGVAEIWFDDLQGLAAVFESERYLEVARPDEAKFLDLGGCEFLVSTESVVIGD